MQNRGARRPPALLVAGLTRDVQEEDLQAAQAA